MNASSIPEQKIPLYKQAAVTGRYQVTMVAQACGGIRRYLPADYGDIFGIWNGNNAQWLWSEERMHAVACAFFDASREGFPAQWQEEWERVDPAILAKSREIGETDLTRLTLEDLRAKYDDLHVLFRDMWAVSIFIDALDAGADRTEIDRIAQTYGFSPEEEHALTTPDTPSYITQWERALSAVKEGTRSAADVAHEFFWMGTDYLRVGEMTEEMATKESRTKDVHPEFVSPAAERGQILAKHGLSRNPLELFQTLTLWRDERKRINFVALYGLMRILGEALRRNEIPIASLSLFFPHEAEQLLVDPAPADLLAKVRAREQGHSFARVHLDGSYEAVDGTEAEEAAQALTHAMPDVPVKELKGAVASRGTAHGIVRVVPHPNSPAGRLFAPGDILVASMTRPEFVPLMRIAAAIITDEGGITSHAAIVSRELGKPCIIGTKVATQVLKDGDTVEVDASEGTVRIIERAQS